MRRWLASFLLVLTALSQASCGDDEPSVPGCGGDVVGEWRIDDPSRLDFRFSLHRGCPIRMPDWSRYVFTGSWAFDESGRLLDRRIENGSIFYGIARDCEESKMKTPPCEELAAAANSPTASMACFGTQFCECSLHLFDRSTITNHRYEVSGNWLTVDHERRYRYCVRDQELWIWPTYFFSSTHTGQPIRFARISTATQTQTQTSEQSELDNGS